MAERYQKEITCLGSVAFLTIVSDHTQRHADNIFLDLNSTIERFENSFSRFKENSELSSFNLNSGNKTKVSPEFKAILMESKKIASDTDGAFNLFILPSLQGVGYLSSWTDKSLVSPDFSDRNTATMDDLTIGSDWALIPKDSALDLGGIGKGFLLDILSENLDKKQIDSYWLSLGGDIICNGLDINNEPWRISVQDASVPGLIVESIKCSANRKQSIATSGITKRKGIHNNSQWHHIINPTTGLPAMTELLSATVIANTGAISDVMAKSIIIKGPKFAIQLKKIGLIAGFILQKVDKTFMVDIGKENL